MSAGDLERIGPFLSGMLGKGMPDERRVASAWGGVVGEEVEKNAQPRSLRNGRLVVATSSSVWAQTLQHMGEQIRVRLNEAVGKVVVTEMVFRPAGWDPGGGQAGPRPLGESNPWAAEAGESERFRGGAAGAPLGRAGHSGADARRRSLTADEEAAVERIRRLACDETLGEQIAGAMRASLERGEPEGEP